VGQGSKQRRADSEKCHHRCQRISRQPEGESAVGKYCQCGRVPGTHGDAIDQQAPAQRVDGIPEMVRVGLPGAACADDDVGWLTARGYSLTEGAHPFLVRVADPELFAANSAEEADGGAKLGPKGVPDLSGCRDA
jgi:hypothetical protein